LKTLNLSYNRIQDKHTIIALAEALAENMSLQKIDFSGNDIDPEGKTALDKAIEKRSQPQSRQHPKLVVLYMKNKKSAKKSLSSRKKSAKKSLSSRKKSTKKSLGHKKSPKKSLGRKRQQVKK
jgi:hypothetical protein